MQIFNKDKLAELILFFARHSQDDRLFGSTKLNKLLFAADFTAYGHLGRSITGATYIHQEQGPTPKPEQFLPIRDELIRAHKLTMIEEETYIGVKKRPVANTEPDLSLFSEIEMDLCRDTLESFKRMSNTEISNWSHNIPGWRYTKQGEEIPYSAVYLWEKQPLNMEDMEWAQNTARQLNLA